MTISFDGSKLGLAHGELDLELEFYVYFPAP